MTPIDPISWPTMQSIVARTVYNLQQCDAPAVCRAGAVPGVIAILEAMTNPKNSECGGQMWVRLVTEFPSANFPAPSNEARNCDVPVAYQLEVGIARIFPTGSASQLGGFLPPTEEEQMEAVRIQMLDKTIMRQSILEVADDLDVAYVLGSYQTINTQADAGGGVWTATFWST